MTIDKISTSEALAYLGISRSTLKRHQAAGAIAPVDSDGQTDLWAVADLNILRQKIVRKQKPSTREPGKSVTNQSQQGEEFQRNLDRIMEAVGDKLEIVVSGNADKDTEKVARTVERRVQETFRARIGDLLHKSNALEVIAADLYNQSPAVRHGAFKLLMDHFLPRLQAMQVEKIGGNEKEKKNTRVEEALRRIAAMEDKQKLMGGPMEVLEGEIV